MADFSSVPHRVARDGPSEVRPRPVVESQVRLAILSS